MPRKRRYPRNTKAIFSKPRPAVFPREGSGEGEESILSAEEMPPLLLTGRDFTRLDLSCMPERITFVVEHKDYSTRFTRVADRIEALSTMPEESDLGEIQLQVARAKGTCAHVFGSDQSTAEMLEGVEGGWTVILEAKREAGPPTMARSSGGSATEQRLIPYRKVPRMHDPRGNVEIELVDFRMLDCTTVPEGEFLQIVVGGEPLFTLHRGGDVLRIMNISVRNCFPVDEKYRDKGLLVQGVDEPHVLIADPKKLGIPENGPPGCSVLAVAWNLDLPATTVPEEIIRVAERRQAEVERAERELVPCFEPLDAIGGGEQMTPQQS